MEEKLKEAKETDVPNLQQAEANIHKSGVGTKSSVPIKPMDVGKKRKMLRPKLFSVGKEDDGIGTSTVSRDRSSDIGELEGPLIC